MSGDAEDHLYGLMEIAERQQAAVQAALDGLVAEREALAAARAEFAGDIAKLESLTRRAVAAAVNDNFYDATTRSVAAAQAAAAPLLEQLAGVAQGAQATETALRRAVGWASWKLLGLAAGFAVTLAVIGWLMSTAVLWWDAGAIQDAQAQKEALQGQVTSLRASYDTWVNSGMLDKIIHCGPKSRPCVQVDENAGSFGDQGDYRVLLGY